MASVLVDITSNCLRSRRAVYNALSSFLCLRFATACIADPSNFFPQEKITVQHQYQSLIPFTQLLQMPFNLQVIHEKYESFKDLSEKMIDRYEEIFNFVLSINDLVEEPQYPKFNQNEIDKALSNILSHIQQGRDVFCSNYNQLFEMDNDKSSTSQSLMTLFSRFFEG